jgi:transposase
MRYGSQRKIEAEFTVSHSADGIALLIRRLANYGEAADMPVGIERPSGRLVDLLLEAGHPVVPVSPNAIKTWREGEVLLGAKTDAGDAAVIAEYLRLRHHRLRVASPYSPQTKALRTVTRTRADLVGMRIAAVNQLAALLDAHWPGARSIFASLDSRIALEFLTRYPTPASAARLSESGWQRSAPSTATPAGARQRSCCSGCKLLPPGPPTRPSPRHCTTPCSPWPGC